MLNCMRLGIYNITRAKNDDICDIYIISTLMYFISKFHEEIAICSNKIDEIINNFQSSTES